MNGRARKPRPSGESEPDGARAATREGRGESEGSEPSTREGAPSRGPRRLAEWLSFGISLALVLALVGYLLWRLREPVTDTVLAQVTLQLGRVSERDGRFVLPIQVKNPGARTVRDLQLRVEYRQRGERQHLDVLIDYVGQSAEQLVYVYFDEDPRAASVRAEAISYLVD